MSAFERMLRQHLVSILEHCETETDYMNECTDVKTFFAFFLFWSCCFTFFNVFFIFKNVGKVQSGNQVNKKHFQNNSNEIHL